MKKLSLLLSIILILTFGVFALASGEEESADQGKDAASASEKADTDIGDYSLVIDSCRLAEDYEGDPVVIVKYIFKNVNDDDAAAFTFAFDDEVYQNGVGLNPAYVLKDNANYSADNQMKEIKKGSEIEVEAAYELNDTETDIEVEVKELFSFDDKTLTKTFSIK